MRLRQRDNDINRLNEECSSIKGGRQGRIRILSEMHVSFFFKHPNHFINIDCHEIIFPIQG